jgi:protease I
MASQPLNGRKVAVLLAPAGSEQVEFTEPKKAVQDAGADVDVIGAEPGEARTYNHDLEPGETFTVDKTFDQVSADDYDALLIPGGTVGADKLRGNADAVRLVRGFFQAGKPAGVICHGPWTLVEAGVVRGRTLTSWHTLATDIRNAGGTWVDPTTCRPSAPRSSRSSRRASTRHRPAACRPDPGCSTARSVRLRGRGRGARSGNPTVCSAEISYEAERTAARRPAP